MDPSPPFPEKFPSLILDFTSALSTTFPEYTNLWSMYTLSTSEEQWIELYNYCLEVYPENFFNILYQNDEIFDCTKLDSNSAEKPQSANVFFLPHVDFSKLYHTEGVTDTTRNSIWKYIQLILFTVVGSVKDTDEFGSTANLFEGIDEQELQSKLTEAMSSIGDFFKNIESKMESSTKECAEGMENMEENMKQSFAEFAESFTKDDNGDGMKDGMEKMFESVFSTENAQDDESRKNGFNPNDLPDPENIHGHLKGLFGDKLGGLASELINELSGELQDTLGINPDNMSESADTGDIFKTMMRNPQKFMGIVQKINSRFQSKMQSGEISREDIMREAGGMIQKMKEMGGNSKEMKEMFKNMTQTMGGGGMPDIGNLANMFGKNTRIDTNALDRMTKMQSTKDRMRANLMKRKEEKLRQEQYTIKQTDNPNQFVYKSVNGEVQERSAIRPVTEQMSDADLNKLVQEIEGDNEASAPKSKNKSKTKNKKSGKK